MRTLTLLPILTLLLLCGYLGGRIVSTLEQNYQIPPPQISSQDLNQQVARIKIDRILNGILEGKIEGQPARVSVQDQLAATDAEGNFKIDVQAITNLVPIPVPDGMNFVASKKGKKYYSVRSKSGANLSPANRVYFATEEEAINAGYKK